MPKKLTTRLPSRATAARRRDLVQRILGSGILDILGLVITSRSKRTRELKEMILRLYNSRIQRAIMHQQRIERNRILFDPAPDDLFIDSETNTTSTTITTELEKYD